MEQNQSETVESASVTPQTTPNESPQVAPAVEAAPKKASITPQFAALAKKEREMQARIAAAEAKERAIAEREAQLAHYTRADEELERDPLAFLAKKGWTYDKLTESVINGQLKRPDLAAMQVDDVRSELNSTKQQIAELKNLLAERDARAAAEKSNRVINRFQHDLKVHLDSNAEKYELVTSQGAHDDVFRLIERHFHENGQVLTFDEAASVIEEALEENVSKLLNAKKIRAKLTPAEAKAEAKAEEGGIKSLSNAAASASLSAAPAAKSVDDLRSEAIQQLTSRWKAK